MPTIYDGKIFQVTMGIHLFEKTLQGDTCKRWIMQHDGTLGRRHGKFVTGFLFLIFRTFSFQDNLKGKLRHAVLLKCARD